MLFKGKVEYPYLGRQEFLQVARPSLPSGRPGFMALAVGPPNAELRFCGLRGGVGARGLFRAPEAGGEFHEKSLGPGIWVPFLGGFPSYLGDGEILGPWPVRDSRTRGHELSALPWRDSVRPWALFGAGA